MREASAVQAALGRAGEIDDSLGALSPSGVSAKFGRSRIRGTSGWITKQSSSYQPNTYPGEQMIPPTVHLSMRFDHHGSHAGYDRISAYMPEVRMLQRLRIGPFWPIFRRIFHRTVRSRIGNHPYKAANALLELNAYRHALLHRRTLYHYLYGEENFRLLRATRSAPLVASFHQPISICERWGVRGEYLKNLSAIVILSEVQRAYFEQYLPSSSIYFVPHGIDTDYFRPSSCVRSEGKFRCLTVGSWLRDHETFQAAIQEVQASPAGSDILFDIVGHPNDRKHYADCPQVRYFSRLPDADLLALYRSADLAVIPLSGAVANNALLEAMASGLPAVVTDIGGVREYTGNSSVAYVPPLDPSALCRAILDLRADPTRRLLLSEQARQNALRFDWKRVADRLREVYADVLHHTQS